MRVQYTYCLSGVKSGNKHKEYLACNVFRANAWLVFLSLSQLSLSILVPAVTFDPCLSCDFRSLSPLWLSILVSAVTFDPCLSCDFRSLSQLWLSILVPAITFDPCPSCYFRSLSQLSLSITIWHTVIYRKQWNRRTEILKFILMLCYKARRFIESLV